MYVCLCAGATCKMVSDAIARGASTSKQVALACGAGLDCGRCLRNVKVIVDAAQAEKSAAYTVSQAC
jgi:bacterioferritin-associated ferredoxin